MNFEYLTSLLNQTHQALYQRATKSVDVALTLRNWLFGYYLVEYEQNGEDRSEYGSRLIPLMAKKLKDLQIKGMSSTNLKLCRQFYLTYPQISQSLTDPSLLHFLPKGLKPKTISPVSKENVPALPPTQLIQGLTFTHMAELVKLDDPYQRVFYEIECLKGEWGVRELKRQIGSLLYERTGLSRDKEKLLQLTQAQSMPLTSRDIMREPYVFEFLGLNDKDVYHEADLEFSLLEHLQAFLLELGRGFCFEARQKRITVDQEHYYIDLVFYHRLLKCHVLIELKNRRFKHTDAGQLNFYLNYYRKHELTTGDNPPVGILLCTGRDEAHVEFATAGLDNQIFVSKYKIALPSEEELKRFVQKEVENFEIRSGHSESDKLF